MSSYLSHAKIIPLTHPTSTSTSSDPVQEPASITLPLPTHLGSSCTSWLSPPPSHEAYDPSSPILVGAGGVDRQSHVFSITPERMLQLAGNTSSPDPSTGCQEIMTLHLHTGPISSLTPSRDYKHVLSSAWDGLLGVFKLPTREEPLVQKHDVGAEPASYLTGQDRRSKKRRLNTTAGVVDAGPNTAGSNYNGDVNGLAPANSGGFRKAPEIVLRGHSGRIGGSIWDREVRGNVWSAGWDGSVRGWDVDSGACEVVKVGPLARNRTLCHRHTVSGGRLISLSFGMFTARTAGTGGALYRPDGREQEPCDGSYGPGRLSLGRKGMSVLAPLLTSLALNPTRMLTWIRFVAASVVSLTLSTPAATPSVTAHPTSHFTLATASYSGHLQIWDVRSPKQALFSVKKNPRKDNKIVGGGTGERLLSVDWDGEVMIAGGEDGEVGVWSARGE